MDCCPIHGVSAPIVLVETVSLIAMETGYMVALCSLVIVKTETILNMIIDHYRSRVVLYNGRKEFH